MDIHDPKVMEELKKRYTIEQIKSLSALYFICYKSKLDISMPQVDFYNAYWRAKVLKENVYGYEDYLFDRFGFCSTIGTPRSSETRQDYLREYTEPDCSYFLLDKDTKDNYKSYQIMKENEWVFKDIVRMLLKPLEDMPLYLGCKTHICKIASWRLKNAV